jgi:hypothetical protein
MFYSQKSFPQKLGSRNTTIKANGCFLVSLSNLINYLKLSIMNPLELNEFLLLKGGYVNGCLMNAPKVASLLGMTYVKTNQNPETLCVAETDHYKSKGVPQHFFLVRKDGRIVDPLDEKPNWKNNPYKIVSWRVFTPMQPPVTPMQKDRIGTLYATESPKIDPGQPEAPKEVSEPKQDEIVPIPVTVTTTEKPPLVADPYPIAENGTPYESEKVDNWFILLIRDFIALWRK